MPNIWDLRVDGVLAGEDQVKGRSLPFGVPPPAVPIWPTDRGQGSDLTPGQVIGSYKKTHPYHTHHATTGSGSEWWNPFTWGKAAISGIISGFEDVSNWVIKIVRDAANLLWEALHTVFHLVTRYATDIFHWAEECFVRAETLIQTVWHDAVHLLDGLRHDVSRWLDDLRHALAHDFDNIRHWIASAYDAATRAAWGFLQHYVFRYLHLAIHWIEKASDWLGHQLASWWDEIYRKFIRPIVHDVASIVHRIERLEHAVFHDLMVGLHLLEEAGDWMIWFAEHSFKDIRDLAEGGEAALVRSWLDAPAGA